MTDKFSNAQFQYKGAYLDLLSSDKGFQNKLAETAKDVEVLKAKLKYSGTSFGNISTGSNVVFHETSDLSPDYEIDFSLGSVFYISLNTDLSNITFKPLDDFSIIQKAEIYFYQKRGNCIVNLPSNIHGQNSTSLNIARTKGFCTKLQLTTFDAGLNYLLENFGNWQVNFDNLTNSEVKPKSRVKVTFTILDAPSTYYGLSNVKLFDSTINDYISFNGTYHGTYELANLILEDNQSVANFNEISSTEFESIVLTEKQIKGKVYTNIDSVGTIVGTFGTIQDTNKNFCSKALLSRNPTLILSLDTNHLITKVKFNNTVKNTETAKYFASKVQVQLYYDNTLIKSEIFNLPEVNSEDELLAD